MDPPHAPGQRYGAVVARDTGDERHLSSVAKRPTPALIASVTLHKLPRAKRVPIPDGTSPIRTRSTHWVFLGQLLLSAMLIATVSATLGAQSSSPPADTLSRDSTRMRVALDSLAARLTRTEAALALLRQQMATESGTQVRLRSRFQLELFARLLTNAYYTTAESNNPEIPILARPASTPSVTLGSAGAKSSGFSIRQSTIGGSVAVDSVVGAMFMADLELDFFGGFGADGPPLFPTPRLRTARAFLTWPKTELMVGADTPLISDLNPVGVAATGTPDFSAAGNLWNWLPQIRITRELGTIRVSDRALLVALQAAAIDPRVGDRHATETNSVDAGLRSARPALEARIRGQWGREHDPTTTQRLGDKGGEIGLGAHVGWLRMSGDSLLKSWATSIDARVGLSHGMELRGEAYRGQILRGLGGGGIGQNFASSTLEGMLGEPLTDIAGWVQLNAQLRPTIISGLGCGTDRVQNGQPARDRNTACAAHFEWRPGAPVLMGMEYRAITTRGAAGQFRTAHFNLFFGVEL